MLVKDKDDDDDLDDNNDLNENNDLDDNDGHTWLAAWRNFAFVGQKQHGGHT